MEKISRRYDLRRGKVLRTTGGDAKLDQIIVEVDGDHHFTQVSNWKSYEETLERL